MSTKTMLKPTRVLEPIAEVENPNDMFPPSAELGQQLQHLNDAQIEIDRKKAEELARLRAIQDRD